MLGHLLWASLRCQQCLTEADGRLNTVLPPLDSDRHPPPCYCQAASEEET